MSAIACSPSIVTPLDTGPVLEIQSGPTASVRIFEIGLPMFLSSAGAQASDFGIGVAAAKGTGFQTFPPQYENTWNNNSLPGITLLTQWSIPPTVPANFFRRQVFSMANTSGNAVYFKFPRGLILIPSSSLVVWIINYINNQGPVTFTPYVVVDA